VHEINAITADDAREAMRANHRIILPLMVFLHSIAVCAVAVEPKKEGLKPVPKVSRLTKVDRPLPGFAKTISDPTIDSGTVQISLHKDGMISFKSLDVPWKQVIAIMAATAGKRVSIQSVPRVPIDLVDLTAPNANMLLLCFLKDSGLSVTEKDGELIVRRAARSPIKLQRDHP
jgi:hypothetical protein